MWISNGMIFIAITLFMQLSNVHGQNACDAAALAACGPYPCRQTDTVYSCLCPDLHFEQSALACNAFSTVAPPVVIPNVCGNVVCSAGATCIPTNQNPAQYVCLCPNNILGNPNCPVGVLPNNPCLLYNPCTNGGTCVVNQLTLQAVCLCPPNTYGTNCATNCRATCDLNWCYNGGRCANLYGQAYCACPTNYRGRRCELRYNQYNYVYLYHSPYYYYGKK